MVGTTRRQFLWGGLGVLALRETTMTSVSTAKLVRAGMWQRTQGIGLENFQLLRATNEWVMYGTVLTLTKGIPTETRYEIVCDAGWNTKRADISLRDTGGERVLRLTAQNGRWYVNGRANEAVHGCIDIDLGWSPSTNTLPIRRLGLAIGKSSGPLTAAWVRFPELTVEVLPQEYVRLSEQRYRYTSRGGAFTAVIEVDDEGLVLDYEGVWRRVGESMK